MGSGTGNVCSGGGGGEVPFVGGAAVGALRWWSFLGGLSSACGAVLLSCMGWV